MEIRSPIAALRYAANKPATSPTEPFLQTAVTAAQDFAHILQTAEEAAQATMVSSADPHVLIEALSQAELAVETAVTLRNKVVEAYQEILRMPV